MVNGQDFHPKINTNTNKSYQSVPLLRGPTSLKSSPKLKRSMYVNRYIFDFETSKKTKQKSTKNR
jgi:hypothetical protein